MNTLTKTERDALDDVFLSIQVNHSKIEKIKEISTLIISMKSKISMPKLYKQAKYGMKGTKFSHFLDYLHKKKKNLSK